VNTEKNPVRDVKEMVGEFFREAAPLILVFAFLDKLIFHEYVGRWWAIATVSLVGTLLIFGIAIERRRKYD
jgi:hypothetical protein